MLHVRHTKSLKLKGELMKSMLIALLTLASASSFAKTINLYTTWNTHAQITSKFDINADLGRAWVSLDINDSPNDSESMSEEKRIKVQGLSYDAQTNEVIYTSDGRNIVCAVAVTRGRGIFRNTTIKNSKDCSFKTIIETKMVDDGFNVRRQRYQTIQLVIAD
jgi:hypothetical protein